MTLLSDLPARTFDLNDSPLPDLADEHMTLDILAKAAGRLGLEIKTLPEGRYQLKRPKGPGSRTGLILANKAELIRFLRKVHPC